MYISMDQIMSSYGCGQRAMDRAEHEFQQLFRQPVHPVPESRVPMRDELADLLRGRY